MNVCVIGPVPPIRGGIAQHTALVANGLTALGHDVGVISWKSQYPNRLYKRVERVEGGIGPAGVRWLLAWWNPVSWIRAGWMARKADTVVMAWVVPVHAPIQFVIALMARKSTIVFHVHNVHPHESIPLATPLARLALGRGNRLICSAQTLADELHDIGIVRPTTVIDMPALVDTPMEPLVARPPVRLLNLGYIRPYKGVEIAIRAIGLLRAKGVDVELTIAGELWDDHLDPVALVDELGLGEAVHLDLRYVADDELAALLASHHALVAPYESATQSAVVPLALAAGRPVIATNVGGLPELVTDGRNGTLAAPGDPAAFAEAIERAIDQLDELAAGAAAGVRPWSELVGAYV